MLSIFSCKGLVQVQWIGHRVYLGRLIGWIVINFGVVRARLIVRQMNG